MVAVYLVDGLLIDSGPPATARQLTAWCRGKRVQQVVNTHHHEDHAGGDHQLQEALGLPVAAPELAVPVLANVPRLELYRRFVWGQPASAKVHALGREVETAHHCFQVIPTPGHSPDHICLFEPEQGWLFGGDLFIHERARYLRADEDVRLLVGSLRQVLALRPQLLICSHAGLVRDARGALERKIAYWDQLGEQARALHREGLPLGGITERLLGKEGWTTRVTRGHMSKANLVRSLLESYGDG
jgi:glyoxylase-like metal-dependent hydrolase (beta-lactamase superfamily II)